LESCSDNLESSRFYRISDKLGLSKNAIEEALARRECDIFNIKHTIFLYDLTNTYFEGSALNNEIAQRGHSKEKRFDCPLVSCGMILNQDGFIVKHQSFAGNIGEAKTLKEQIQSLEEDYKGSLIVIDSGIASAENLQMIKDMGFDYITVAKRPSRLAYEEQFADLDKFRKIQGREDKSDVLINAFEKDDEKLIACISSQREKKEKAILSLAEERLLKDLQGLCGSIDKGTLKVQEKINRRIGRLLERHSRVARYYEIAYNKDKNALEYSRKQEYEHASMLCGGYVLRCSRKDMADADIWRIYIMLTKVESGFRALKSDLGLRPIYHQKASRTSDHIFISILAYHLLHWIEYKLQTEGMNISWRALKRLLQTHGYATILADAEQGVCRIRKAGRAEPKQQEIYEKLGIELNSLPTIKSFTAKQ